MRSESSFALLGKRRFLPFFLTQFLGAFNDNVFKNGLLALITFQAASELGGGVNESLFNNLAAGLFILPFFLFSATAGQLADKYEKSQLMRLIKIWEIGVMILGAIGFVLGNLYLLIGVLFLMGTQSAFFGPVKYGILPQHLDDSELVAGNGLVEMGTFLAIILGIMAGGLLTNIDGYGVWIVAAAVIALAGLGYASSRGIPKAPALSPELKINWNLFTETWRNIGYARGNRTVFLSVMGISWFWFLGAVYLTQLPEYTKEVLHGDQTVMTLLLALFSIGIGFGSVLCDRLSGHKVELGLVPFGSIGLTAFGVDLAFATGGMAATASMDVWGFLDAGGSYRVITDILLIGLFGGFYIVPLYALIQQRSEPSHRSRIIAANNIINAGFMVLAAAFAIALLGPAGLDIPILFLVLAVLNAVVAFYIYALVPEFLMRFLIWVLIHTVYRVRKEGLEHIPEEGAAVLVCNHVSFVDALVIAGAVRRPVRFVMYYKIFNIPLLSFIFRTAKAIPIAGAKEDPEMLERAFARIREELAAGELVCIFPEGQLTASGEMSEFRNGVERIVQESPVPVIPMALRGLWGSMFSRKGGAAFFKLPRKLWARIGLVVGEGVPPEEARAALLQERVAHLRGESA